MLVVLVHACDPDTLEAEPRGSRLEGHPQLHSKFWVSLGYVRPGTVHPQIVFLFKRLKTKVFSFCYNSVSHIRLINMLFAQVSAGV